MKHRIRLLCVSLTFATAILFSMNHFFDSSFSQIDSEKEKLLQDQVATNYNYVHKADLNRASVTILLNGISLIQNDTLLLYDSTPFASKGHISLNLPCDPEQPGRPMFQTLIGLAPSLFPMALGHVEQISNSPRSCIFHGQFGFGDPVTDIALKYDGSEEISFLGPHSVTITTHEAFIPTNETFKEKQHLQGLTD